jgi:4-hydroxythreonine-4-phosphate dehydrogenase
VLATVHLPLADVASTLSIDRIVAVTRLGAESLRRDFGIDRPRIGVLGLNPHAGEGGLLGREEQRIIAPAIERCRAELGDRFDIAGPLVPDVAFRQRFDLWVAMYHDQALIPLKLDDVDATVNVTLGLPIVRTSPDHGVAHDIAGRGLARPDSFIAALELAVEMVERRR